MQRISLMTGSLWVWLTAKQLSDVSASLNTIVIGVYALALFDNPAVLGIILALKMAGSVLGAFLVPFMTRLWPPRRILIGSDFANASLTLTLALSPSASHQALFLALPLILGIFQGTFHVALYSQSHLFLGPEKRHRMNSILASMDGVAVVAGGMLASVVYGLVSVQTIFLMSAGAYLMSGVAFIRFSDCNAIVTGTPTDIGQSRLKGFSIPLLRTIFGAVSLIFAARSVEAFGSATHNVGFSIISTTYDPQNSAFLVGWIMAIWGLGKIVAMMVTPAMVSLLERRGIIEDHLFIAFLMITFAFFLGIFFFNILWLILTFAFLAGVFDASTETVYYEILQNSRIARTDQLISVSYLVERAGMGLGIILVAYAFSIGPARGVSALFYLGSIGICAVLLAFSVSARRNTMGEEVIDAKDERFWRDLEPIIFDQERMDRATEECSMILRTLNLGEKLRILDVGCGTGRHAFRFAQMGNHVEGIDAIPYLIQKAQSRTSEESLSPRFHIGDAARFSNYGTREFDCAVSLYHSLGYSDDAHDDARTLTHLHDLLRPGGKVFLELIDPDGFTPGQTLDLSTPTGSDFYDERIEIDLGRRSYVLTIRKRSSSHLIYRARHRLFSREAISNLLNTAGFKVTWPSPDLLIRYPGGSKKFCVVGERGI